MGRRGTIVPFLLVVTLYTGLGAIPAGCRSPRFSIPFDLRETGWTVHQGQAIWRAGSDRPEIAGELIAARHPDGRLIVQFVKTPFPILVARNFDSGWDIEFVPEHRIFSGRGQPSPRFIWLHLGPVLFDHQDPPKNWSLKTHTDFQWELENRVTGEILKGYFNP